MAHKLAKDMGSPITPISLDSYLIPKWMPKARELQELTSITRVPLFAVPQTVDIARRVQRTMKATPRNSALPCRSQMARTGKHRRVWTSTVSPRT